MSEEIHKCELCGSPVTIGGDDKEGTHYYQPAVSAERLAALERVAASAAQVTPLSRGRAPEYANELNDWELKEQFAAVQALAELDKVNP